MATHAKVLLAVALPALVILGGCGGKKVVKEEFRAETP